MSRPLIRSQGEPDSTVTREDLIDALYLALEHSYTSIDPVAARMGGDFDTEPERLRRQADAIEKREAAIHKARQILRRATGKSLEWYA